MEPVVESRPTGWRRQDRLVVDLPVWLNEESPGSLKSAGSSSLRPRETNSPRSRIDGSARPEAIGRRSSFQSRVELFGARACLGADRNDVDASR
jgi:hypothetical protein